MRCTTAPIRRRAQARREGDAGRRFGGLRLGGLVAAVIAMASLVGGAGAARATGTLGTDFSWPQCHQAPPAAAAITVVGVTGGRPFTVNPCLTAQWASTAGTSAAVYVNLAFPSSPAAWAAGPQPCAAADTACEAWNAGWAEARAALDAGAAAGVDAGSWWLDVETGNTWSSNQEANARVIDGAASALRDAGRIAGVYSAPFMWSRIVGSWAPPLPAWLAIGSPGADPASGCTRSFTAAPVVMVQWVSLDRDVDLLCGWAAGQVSTLFNRGRAMWVIRPH